MSYGAAPHKGAAGGRPAPYTQAVEAGTGAFGSASSEATDCKVYIGNLAYKTTWRSLKDHMAQAGTVTYCKVFTLFGARGLANTDGWSKGTALVEYASQQEALTATQALNNSELDGRQIFVDAWDASGASKSKGLSGGALVNGKGKSKVAAMGAVKGSGKSKGSGNAVALAMSLKGGAPSSWPEMKGGKGLVKANPACKIFVGNLAYKTSWTGLKTHFERVGTVVYAKVNIDKGKGKGKVACADGWSKGTGLIEFSLPEEATLAIKTLNKSELDGRNIVVEMWS